MNRDALVESGDRMVAYVRRVNAREPGTRAALRRGLGRPPEDIANFHAHAIVTRYLPENHDRATERAFYTVAALVAAQPRGARDQEAAEASQDEETATSTLEEPPAYEAAPPEAAALPADGRSAQQPRLTLGQTLARAVENGHLKGDMVRDRLHLLARYRTDRLHRELPKLIAHLRADHVWVDWGLLLRDLARWGTERAYVSKQWVQQYHRTRDQIQRQRSQHDQTATPDSPESETV
ncbi:type I-E CRISPR-associated protein Cse2/CasB [Nocardiopsis salina]|uniref:type I-E CRISPR-associated protein Cse2/CasB n=1 Tax=Nocardiopsis salina TaxID=245836 RepID=UPI00034CC0E5|nr:type I-E CRISPR-associated protein Cse2/CasB [Nocardiopsis salina]